MSDNARPIADSYWVIPGKLLAGRRPVVEEAEAFLATGVTYFIDLTFDGEFGLGPYAETFAVAAKDRSVKFRHRRFAIVDRSVPEVSEMKEILSDVDKAVAAGERVYLHCFGGIGRTGTAVGCHLVSHGTATEEALVRLIELRRGIPSSQVASPETDEQRTFIRDWHTQDVPEAG